MNKVIFNAEQKKAIQTTDGLILILAGAGSGKTKVIIERIAHLIKEKQVPPSAILGLTFTNKAADEMKERLSSLIGKKAKDVLLSTFHSFCVKLLREEIKHLGFTSSFSLYDEKDMHRLAKDLAHEISGDQTIPSLQGTLDELATQKNKADESFAFTPFTKKLAQKLKKAMRAHNAVDLDSLIPLTLELFQEYPDILGKYQENFRYIMIDEYQDTNGAQSQLLYLLAKKHKNLCVVGDDDQAIYGWRGAEVRNILSFPHNTLIKLEENFRSTSIILDAANEVIAKNKNRHGKALWTQRKSQNPIELFHAPSPEEEAKGIVFRILQYKKMGIPFDEMAILYRSNALSRHFERALIQASYQDKDKWRRGIPFEIYGGLAFSETKEAKDLIAFLKLLDNPHDHDALLRIINVPKKRVSSNTIDILSSLHKKEKKPMWEYLKRIDGFSDIPGREKSALSFLVKNVEDAKQKKGLYTSIHSLLHHLDYKKSIQEESSSEKAAMFKLDNMEELLSALKGYEEISLKEDKTPSMKEFLTSANITAPKSKKKGFGVKMMTFHSAKGLEFEACFLTCLEDHILPHEKCYDIEEERRLFYVALTRAKRYLCLSMARKRKKHKKMRATLPSRFLHDIPKKLFGFSVWDIPHE